MPIKYKIKMFFVFIFYYFKELFKSVKELISFAAEPKSVIVILVLIALGDIIIGFFTGRRTSYWFGLAIAVILLHMIREYFKGDHTGWYRDITWRKKLKEQKEAKIDGK